ncbi:MAG: translocation/assembly module TamB domain-containing protein, partial [Holophagales bacterium]|nr:translocation/assembly module TamB domain-containing protein [Holophagales bacterium]
ARAWAEARLASELSTALGRQVTLEEVDFDLLPLEVELWGLEISGGPGSDGPFLRLPFARAELELDALRHRRLHLRLLRLERPELDLRFYPEGGSNLIGGRSGADRTPFEVRIDQLEVDRAGLGLDHARVPLTVDAEGLRLRLRGVAGRRLEGQAGARGVRVRLPGARLMEVSVRAEGTLAADGLVVENARLSSPQGQAKVEGGCEWSRARWQNRKCSFHLEGESRGESLRDLGYFSGLEGPFAFRGELAWRPGSLGWRGPVTADLVRIWGRPASRVEGRLSADRFGVRLWLDRARYGGGEVSGQVLVELGGDREARSTGTAANLPGFDDLRDSTWRRAVGVVLDFDGVSLDPLLEDQGLVYPALAARVDGSLRYVCDRARGLSGNGYAEVRLLEDPADGGLPIQGAFPLRIERGVARVESANLLAERHSLLAGGWYRLADGHGRFEYQVQTTDVGELVLLLPSQAYGVGPGGEPRHDSAEGAEDPGRDAPGERAVGEALGGEVDASGPGARSVFLPTAGRGRLEGILETTGGDLFSRLYLDLEQVETPRLDVASAKGILDVTPWAAENLDLRLEGPSAAPEGSLDVRGRMPFGEEGRALLELYALAWPMAEVWPWLDFPLPLEGPVTGQLDLEFTSEERHGRLAARMEPAEIRTGGVPGSAFGLELDGVSAELSWGPSGMEVSRVRAFAPAGVVQASGRLSWGEGSAPEPAVGIGERSGGPALRRREPPGLDLRLQAERLDLGQPPFAALLPRRDLDAEVALEGRLGGTWNAPELELEARVLELVVGGRQPRIEPARLLARWDGEDLQLDGGLGSASLVGGGRLDADGAELVLELTSDELGELLGLGLSQAEALGGEGRGRLRLTADWSGGPGEVDAEAALDLEALELRLDGRRLEVAETATLTLGTDGLRVVGLELREGASHSRIRLEGEVGYGADPALALEVDADVDAGWTDYFLPGLELGGRLLVSGRVGGTAGRPSLEGEGRARGLGLPVPGLAQGFSEMEGEVRFHGRRVVLESLRGRFSGGEALVTGELDLDSGPEALPPGGDPRAGRGGEAGLAASSAPASDPEPGSDPSYRFDFRATGVTVPAVEGWSVAGDLDLSFRSLPAEQQLLSGSARLGRLEYLEDIRFDFAQLMRDFLRGQRLRVEAAENPLSRVLLELRVMAPGTVRVTNNLADLEGSADLVLRGNLARPVLFGEVVMDAGGRLRYNSADYEVTRGRLIFSDPYRSQPEVDLVATTRVRDFDVTLDLAGPLERLDARFSSEPPLPSVEVFRLLAGGDAYVEEAELAPDRSAEIGEERGTSAATLLYGQAASAIGDRVNNLFGFDKFRIDPLTGSDDNLSKARITVGKRLSKDVFVTYSVDPSSSQNQRIQVEWQVADGLVLVLTQNGDDSFSADARWETSF